MKTITLGNKDYQIRIIPETGYQATDNERGSAIIEYVCTTFIGNYPIRQENGTRRIYFDKAGNVYKTNKSKKIWFNYINS